MPKSIGIVEGFSIQEQSIPILRGYEIVQPDISENAPFAFFAKCNVEPEECMSVFWKLFELLPSQLQGLIGELGEEVYVSPSTSKSRIRTIFKKALADHFLEPSIEFGMMSVSDRPFTELFLKNAKYILFWGSDLDAFLSAMETCQLPSRKKLKTIDDYPCTLKLSEYLPGETLIREIALQLEKAPPNC